MHAQHAVGSVQLPLPHSPEVGRAVCPPEHFRLGAVGQYEDVSAVDSERLRALPARSDAVQQLLLLLLRRSSALRFLLAVHLTCLLWLAVSAICGRVVDE